MVALAAAAGGLKALIEVFSLLPVHCPAAIAAGQYLNPKCRSLTAEILSLRTLLKEQKTGDRSYKLARRERSL